MTERITPEPPADLDEAAKIEWNRVTKLKAVLRGELTLLEAYVRSWSKWQAAETRLAAEGPTLRQPLPKGRFKVVQNPLSVVAARYQRQTLSAARLLKLHLAHEQVADDWNAFEHLDDDDYDEQLQKHEASRLM